MAVQEDPDTCHEHSVRKHRGCAKRWLDKDFKARRSRAHGSLPRHDQPEQLATCSAAMKNVVFKHDLLAKDRPAVTLTEAILDVAFCTRLPPTALGRLQAELPLHE